MENPKEIIPADDSGLTLLVDYCKKTVATVGGDGHSEIVLYYSEADDTYQVHTYELHGVGGPIPVGEVHHAYRADKQVKDEVYALIDELKLIDYKDARGFGLCGGEYVVKFKADDGIIRISTDNLGAAGPGLLVKVGDLLYSKLV